MGRVMQVKYTAPNGIVYDSREEYLYHQMLLDNEKVSCIHRQVRLNIFPTLYMSIPRQLKTKVRFDKRTLMNGHSYKPDFIFFEDDRLVICDVKSAYTSKLREFRITAKGVLAKIVAHNKKRHDGEPYMIFREAIRVRNGVWKITDYPPKGGRYW